MIPSNDDAIRAIKLLVGKIADAAIEGKALRKDEEPEEGTLPMRPTSAHVEEPELSDEELLGASTLAKISPKSLPIALSEDDEELLLAEIEEVWEGEADVVEDAEGTEDLEDAVLR